MTATYTVKVTKTATATTYTITLPAGECAHAVLVLPVPPASGEPDEAKTWDQI